jgi:hypothetical protein
MLRFAETLLLLLSALAAEACDDPSFIAVEAPEAGAAAKKDAGGEGGFDVAACQACLNAPDMPGPGCQTEIQACEALTDCAPLLPCSAAMNCYGLTQAGFINCGLPCGTASDISAAMGPGFTAAVAYFMCVTAAC